MATGTYNENLVINKQLILNGAQHGVTAVGRTGDESIIHAADSNVYVVKITANNVTLDGFTITGMANGGDNQAAVITWGVDYCTITNNILTDNYKDAINLFSVGTAYSDHNTVSYNVINGPNGVGETFGIKIKGSHNTISGNHVYNTDTPIHIWSWDESETASPDYNNISSNTIGPGAGTAAHKWGIDIKTGHNNVVTTNTITGAERAAIHLYTSDRMASETGFDPRPANVTISNNTISGGEVGIALMEGVNTNTIHNNNISGTSVAGILGSLSRWPEDWSGKTLTYTSDANYLNYLQIVGNTIRNNTLSNCGHGIAMEYADNNTLTGNIIQNNISTDNINWHGVVFTADAAGVYFDANSSGNIANFNDIKGNAGGLKNANTTYNLDATNNWWGDVNGPNATDNPSDGNDVSANVSYSPWLGQQRYMSHSWKFYVDDVGPKPAAGYIQTAINGASAAAANAADNVIDIINVATGTYDENVIVNKRLFFATTPDGTVHVTSFELSNAARIKEGAFSVDTVFVKTGDPDSLGGGIGDAINFVKDGGEIEVEGKEKQELCQYNHWTGGLTINKSLTLKSSANREVCLTGEDGPAITITNGTSTIKSFVLFDSAVGVYAQGGQTTIKGSSIVNNDFGVISDTGAEVNAAYNWWGSAKPNFNTIVSGNVNYSPWYTNPEKTSLAGTPNEDNQLTLPTEVDIVVTTDVGEVTVEIPDGITVTGEEGWTGEIKAPEVKKNSSVKVTPEHGKTATVSAVIEIGYEDVKLTFDKPVRISIANQAGKYVGYSRDGEFTPITTVCNDDNQDIVDAQLRETEGDCKIDVGNDLVVWTKHFTKFVTYTQAPMAVIGGGGGGWGDLTAPSTSDITLTVGDTYATISWKTNETSLSWIVYGTTTAYGLEKKTTSYVTSHSLTLSDLSPETTYHYQIKSKDIAGNIGSYTDKTFTTLALGEEPKEVVEEEVVKKPITKMTVEELRAEITRIMASIKQLQAELLKLKGCTIDRNLKLGMTGDDVKCLQIILNSASDTQLTASGVGSSGQETTYFGPLTKTAVIKFQEKYASEILAPWDLTAGTGFVGSTTRAKLNTFLGK